MAYWGIRFLYVFFMWFFVLNESIFSSHEINDSTFFSTLILFLFPFFLDYIGMPNSYGIYYKWLPLFITGLGLVFAAGGLMTKVLNVSNHELLLIIINFNIHIPFWLIWLLLFIWVILAAIDAGKVSTSESNEVREKIKDMSRRELEDNETESTEQRVKAYNEIEIRKGVDQNE